MRFPPDPPFPELVDAYEDVARIGGAMEEDFVFIVDVGPLSQSSAKSRSHIAKAESDIYELPAVIKHCRGIAIIVRGTWQRGWATAVSWLVRRPCPVNVVGDIDTAMRWAESQLGIYREQETA